VAQVVFLYPQRCKNYFLSINTEPAFYVRPGEAKPLRPLGPLLPLFVTVPSPPVSPAMLPLLVTCRHCGLWNRLSSSGLCFHPHHST
jgi:hypothetical protein